MTWHWVLDYACCDECGVLFNGKHDCRKRKSVPPAGDGEVEGKDKE